LHDQVASAAQLAAGMKPKKKADKTFTREDIPKNVKRVIIKVGTSVLTRDQEFGVSLTVGILSKCVLVSIVAALADSLDH